MQTQTPKQQLKISVLRQPDMGQAMISSSKILARKNETAERLMVMTSLMLDLVHAEHCVAQTSFTRA